MPGGVRTRDGEFFSNLSACFCSRFPIHPTNAKWATTQAAIHKSKSEMAPEPQEANPSSPSEMGDSQQPERIYLDAFSHLEHWDFTNLAHSHWLDATKNAPARSGLACAIVVLRHLVSFFDPETRAEFWQTCKQPAGQHNLVLGMVGLVGDDTFMDSMCSMMEELVGFTGLCFSELMESEVMQQTVWGTDLFNMFLHVAHRGSKEQPWRQGRVP